jgi:hypothetical protein
VQASDVRRTQGVHRGEIFPSRNISYSFEKLLGIAHVELDMSPSRQHKGVRHQIIGAARPRYEMAFCILSQQLTTGEAENAVCLQIHHIRLSIPSEPIMVTLYLSDWISDTFPQISQVRLNIAPIYVPKLHSVMV